MSFGAPVRNGIGIGLRASTSLSTRGGGGAAPLTVSDVFSTYLYNGNSTARNIVNGIDLSGEGGMVWIKTRTTGGAGWDHVINDTVRGPNKSLFSNTTGGQLTSLTNMVTGFNADGFSLGNDANSYLVNQTGYGGYASWTFREAPKFFDVVTYTGDGVNGRAISHSLGTTPGFIIVKRTNNTGNWYTWHRAYNGGNNRGALNTYGNFDPAAPIWGDGSSYIAPTSTTFTVSDYFEVNGNSDTFVAYLFAHDPAADGLIQCGSYTGNGSVAGPTVTLGYEPQWLIIRQASGSDGAWQIIDNMRGMPVGAADATLQANLANAESLADYVSPTATGFQVVSTSNQVNASGSTYIYIAIRKAV